MMKYAKFPALSGTGLGAGLALLMTLFATPAIAADNPFIAGMRAMLNSMGFEEQDSPFSDESPFDGMMDSMPYDSFSWSTMGSMPGMGFSPWSGMPGMGFSPWSGMMPGLGGSPWSDMMPGSMSPWRYANPDQWSKYMDRGARQFSRGANPNSTTREIDGLWEGPNGEKLWFKDGWVRVYRDVHSDARARTEGRYLFLGIPETKQVMQFEYGIRGKYLGLRDGSGNVQIFRRRR